MAATYPDPVPPKGRVGSLLFALPPAGRRWSVALRAALAFAAPATIITGLGHPDAAVFVMFGAFAVLYGEGRPFRVRGRVVLAAGSALLAACGVGAMVGSLLDIGFGSSLLMVVVVSAIAVVAVFVIDALRLGPPGALFFALVCAGAMRAAEVGTPVLTLLFCTACGVVASIVVSMAGVLRDRRKPERVAVGAAVRAVDAYVAAREAGTPAIDLRHRAGAAMADAWAAVYDAGLPSEPGEAELLATLQEARRNLAGHAPDDDTDDLLVDPLVSFARPGIGFRLERSLSFSSHAAISAMRVAVGCLGAGALSALLGLERPHWAVLSALIVLQTGPDRVRGQVRAIHRFVGTIAGLGLFALIYQLGPTGYALIALVAALQFCIELFVPRNYALAVVFITPVALIAGGVATTGGPIGPVIRDRLWETLAATPASTPPAERIVVSRPSIEMLPTSTHNSSPIITSARFRARRSGRFRRNQVAAVIASSRSAPAVAHGRVRSTRAAIRSSRHIAWASTTRTNVGSGGRAPVNGRRTTPSTSRSTPSGGG